jgi:hypothetical protein
MTLRRKYNKFNSKHNGKTSINITLVMENNGNVLQLPIVVRIINNPIHKDKCSSENSTDWGQLTME